MFTSLYSIHTDTLMKCFTHSYLPILAFSALTLLAGRQEGHQACKRIGGWWRWALVSPDGVAPSRMVSVSASVNLPLHNKVQKFSSGTGSPGWSQIKGHKTVVVVVPTSTLMAVFWVCLGETVSPDFLYPLVLKMSAGLND